MKWKFELIIRFRVLVHMGKIHQISGRKFGKLTAIKNVGSDKFGYRLWKCECECGNTTITKAYLLIKGDTKSCGCLQKEKASKIRSLDIRNKKFGRLLAISKSRIKNKYTYWKCRCDCGNIVEIITASLVNGNTKSCGCYNSDLRKERSGNNHPNWNSNLSVDERNKLTKYRKISDIRFIDWSRKIKERDKFTCQKCFQNGGKLRSHHICSWNEYPELRYELNNGICLCNKCHLLFHKTYKYKGFSMKEMKEFLNG